MQSSTASRVVVVALVFLSACTHTSASERGASPTPSVARLADRYYPDMSKAYRVNNFCDFPPGETVRSSLAFVGQRAAPRAAAQVRILAVGGPRWNTFDGRRPSQYQSDSIITRWNVAPGIYRPVRLEVLKVYAGSVPLGRLTAFANTGTIGEDQESSCAFGSPTTLQIRDGPAVAKIGNRYVAFLGAELVPGSGGFHQPTIADLIVITGNRVIGYSNKLEDFPL